MIRISGCDHVIPAGELAFILPGTEHFQYTTETSWHCHWVTFDGTASLAVVLGFGFDTSRPQRAGACPVARFQQLESIAGIPGGEVERKASTQAYDLLSLAAGQAICPRAMDPTGIVDVAIEYLHTLGDDLNLGVAQLADRVGVHRSILSRHFQEQLGCSPSIYLGNLRLMRAMHLLEHTDLPVGLIAHRVGFRDAGYFARLMRNEYCFSPTEYRRRCQGHATDLSVDPAPWRHRSGIR